MTALNSDKYLKCAKVCSVRRWVYVQRKLCNSLGMRLIALNGRSTRIVRIADKLRFCVSTAYSTTLRRATSSTVIETSWTSGPALRVITLFGRTRPQQWRSPTFWKVICLIPDIFLPRMEGRENGYIVHWM